MAIKLRADNRILVKDSKYSYILSNTSSGASSIVVANTDGFSSNDFIVIGNIGSENTELCQVNTVTSATGTLTLVSNTRFAHSESTRVTIVGYNKVSFYHTALPTIPPAAAVTTTEFVQNEKITESTSNVMTSPASTTYSKSSDPTVAKTISLTPPITTTSAALLLSVDICPDSVYTTYSDTTNSTGYGWFAFYNTVTDVYSSYSNPIPYAGFDDNTVKEIFSSFNSCLNQKELRLISDEDRYSWANEGFSYMVNELNLGNWEYNASEPLILNVVAGQDRYLLPDDFSNMLYINEANGDKILHYEATFQPIRSSNVRRYMIAGRWIVFDPVPGENASLTFSYQKKSKRLSGLHDVVDLPDNSHYSIKDFMLYRAYRKLGNLTESNNSLQVFNKNVDRMKIYSIKRDNGLDSWSIADEANV